MSRVHWQLEGELRFIDALDVVAVTVWWLLLPLPILVGAVVSQRLTGRAWVGAIGAATAWCLTSLTCRLRLVWQPMAWQLKRTIAGVAWSESGGGASRLVLFGTDLMLLGPHQPVQVLSSGFHRVSPLTLQTIAHALS